VLVIVLGACGISENSHPELLAPDNVPYNLLDPPGAASTTAPASASTVTATVYFVERFGDQTRLRAADREIARPARAEGVIEALFDQPPDETERRLGLTTSIPDQAQLRSVEQDKAGVVHVNLSDGFQNVTGQGLRVAYAQLVWTAMGVNGVTGVQFAVEGQKQNAITGDGTPKAGPVRTIDYAEFRPR
jgi:spore germination protein GerM